MANAVRKVPESVGAAVLSRGKVEVEEKRNVFDEDELICGFWPCSGSTCTGKLSDSLFKLRTAVAYDIECARDGDGRGGVDIEECSVNTGGGNVVSLRKAMVPSVCLWYKVSCRMSAI